MDRSLRRAPGRGVGAPWEWKMAALAGADHPTRAARGRCRAYRHAHARRRASTGCVDGEHGWGRRRVARPARRHRSGGRPAWPRVRRHRRRTAAAGRRRKTRVAAAASTLAAPGV
ncbi:hypothetical protein BU14_0071s0006 [Porphyra umbilicalis]|uniref:Uncharacterized protein n=1 Tax=Porphyra umbilicalis TaxID=2786 RepID=A0A1X6PFX6_PORUM|nr:hypothetical protein BU14_0071s0006 [Porphyra umbilicalis]|eukprot:OSX79751.1 hypothetical protein BU14_0071s0006 [Porphyra umbilicalis]